MTTQYLVSEQFYEDVIGILGGTLVDVELEKTDVSLAFRLAKRVFVQRGQNNTDRAFCPLSVEAGKAVYPVSPNVDVVNNVIRPSGMAVGEDAFSLGTFQEIFGGYSSGSQQYSSGQSFLIYDLTLQHMDNIRQKMVDEPEIVFNKRNSTIRFLKPPRSNQVWMLDVYKTPTDEELEKEEWIFRYAVAECKMILGRAYRKFSSLASPTGENQLDGSDLVREGQEEKQKLEEDILEFTSGDPTGLGIYIG